MATRSPQAVGRPDDVSAASHLDFVIVGAGFAGIYMLHRAREAGLSARVFEAGSGVGGTWFWNRYPGARCDVESLEYQYSFSKELREEWVWSERYSAQPEIERYANFVADKLDLRRDIQLNTRVAAATFDEDRQRWAVETEAGDHVTGTFLIMATGCLSAANLPNIPGRDSFEGKWYHTGLWPQEGVDVSGLRVAVIGTGSSGIQSIPVLAQQAKELTVFQRTPSFSLPATNGPIPSTERSHFLEHYDEILSENLKMPGGTGARFKGAALKSVLEVLEQDRDRVFTDAWTQGGFSFMRSFTDIATNHDANGIAAEFVRGKIRSVIDDPAIAELLCPEIPIGCKRMVIDVGYYQTFNQPHVTLRDARVEPIQEITPKGVRTDLGEYEFDVIVFATGFDAMTGALTRVDIRGRDGVLLKDEWWAGPKTYLGLTVTGFPNMFTITGPGSPSVLTNMIRSIEHHVDWIVDCVEYLRERDITLIEATPAAQSAWVDHVNDVASRDIMHTADSCNSWYLGANIPGKTRVFMPLPGLPAYIERCAEIADAGYKGFVLTAAE